MANLVDSAVSSGKLQNRLASGIMNQVEILSTDILTETDGLISYADTVKSQISPIETLQSIQTEIKQDITDYLPTGPNAHQILNDKFKNMITNCSSFMTYNDIYMSMYVKVMKLPNLKDVVDTLRVFQSEYKRAAQRSLTATTSFLREIARDMFSGLVDAIADRFPFPEISMSGTINKISEMIQKISKLMQQAGSYISCASKIIKGNLEFIENVSAFGSSVTSLPLGIKDTSKFDWMNGNVTFDYSAVLGQTSLTTVQKNGIAGLSSTYNEALSKTKNYFTVVDDVQKVVPVIEGVKPWYQSDVVQTARKYW